MTTALNIICLLVAAFTAHHHLILYLSFSLQSVLTFKWENDKKKTFLRAQYFSTL